MKKSDVLENLRVLVVDDNVTNRHILEHWLHSWRMRPTTVGDGTAALSAVTQAIEMGMPYSLVLLDRRMPDADGLLIAEQIRKCTGASIRVILLSSEDSMADTARSREMGISALLLKPLQQSELLEVILEVMSRANGERTQTIVGDPTPASDGAPRRILVAEDNEFNVILLKQLFSQKGHSVQIASNGREALELASGGEFDLLLLDIHMPEMDGFEVVQTLRERERTSGRHLPVIALTARSAKQDRERCLAAGMDDFLSKPVQADALWAVIDRNVASHPVKRCADMDLIDPAAILRACGGDGAILQKICQAFQASVPNQMTRVRTALHDNDAPRLREAAHMLCGTLAAFSTVAGTTASNLEDAAARGQIDDCKHMVEQLETMYSALVEQTRSLSIEKLTP